ncbi:hypothetical protein TALC_00975 [Thermoplasmatales archaeon BRNA1]|nr:hypothetical protein TALC_00975 [Thermoplasmatales archaeon BRNA1]
MKLRFKSRGENRPGSASMDPSGILNVDCRGCQQVPDAGSPVCIRCITSAIASEGNSDRIRLTAGKDTEISGDAADILCDLATMDRSPVPVSGDRRCRQCQRSPWAVMDAAWADFPEPNFAYAKGRLHSESGDMAECASCMQRTGSAISVSEESFARVKKKASSMTAGGVR